MYSLTDITKIHLELTNKCQARCPMCPRRIQGGPLNPHLNLDEINLDKFKSWLDVSFIKQLTSLYMCGNYGDPIIAHDCLEIFEYLREINPSIDLSMHTNGSARNSKFWESLAKLNVRVVFGIDGLEDTHKLYRIGTDFHQLIHNATTFIQNGGIAEWHMLVFTHNEHQIEVCRSLAKEMGFITFKEKHTTRFRENKLNVLDDEGKTVNILYPTEYSKILSSKVKKSIVEIKPVISCKVVNDKSIYISANGDVTPCCWLENKYINPQNDLRIDYMDKIGYHPNLNNSSLEEIFNSDYFTTISQSWTNDPVKECTKQCGSFDKLFSQFS